MKTKKWTKSELIPTHVAFVGHFPCVEAMVVVKRGVAPKALAALNMFIGFVSWEAFLVSGKARALFAALSPLLTFMRFLTWMTFTMSSKIWALTKVLSTLVTCMRFISYISAVMNTRIRVIYEAHSIVTAFGRLWYWMDHIMLSDYEFRNQVLPTVKVPVRFLSLPSWGSSRSHEVWLRLSLYQAHPYNFSSIWMLLHFSWEFWGLAIMSTFLQDSRVRTCVRLFQAKPSWFSELMAFII